MGEWVGVDPVRVRKLADRLGDLAQAPATHGDWRKDHQMRPGYSKGGITGTMYSASSTWRAAPRRRARRGGALRAAHRERTPEGVPRRGR